VTYNELNNLRERFFNLLESEMGNVKPLLSEEDFDKSNTVTLECTNVAIYNSTGSGGKLVFGYKNADNTKGYVEAKYIFPEKDHKSVLNFDQTPYKKQFPQEVNDSLFSKGSSFKLSIPSFIQNPQPAKQTSVQDKYGKIQPASSDATSTKTWKTQHGDKTPLDVSKEIEYLAVSDRGGDLSDTQKNIGWLGLGFNILAGILRGPLGWAALGAGVITDAIGYYDITQRTDSIYEKGVYLAFMLLYLDDVRFLLKGSSFTEDALRKLISDMKTFGISNNVKQNPIFKWCAKKLSVDAAARQTINNLIENRLKATLLVRMTEQLQNRTLPYILIFLRNLHPVNTKLGKWLWSNKLTLANAAFQVVGTYVTFDQLYLAFYHPECLQEGFSYYDENKRVVDVTACRAAELKKLSEREQNVLRTILRDYVTGGAVSKEVTEFVSAQYRMQLPKEEKEVLNDEQKFYDKNNWEQLESQVSVVDDKISMFFGNIKYYEKPVGQRNPEEIEDRIKNIAKDVYDSIEGVGTSIELLRDALRKLNNFTDFKLMNVYLSYKYGENFFDLANSFLELELEEKKRMSFIFRPRNIPIKVNNNGKFVYTDSAKDAISNEFAEPNNKK